MASPLSETLKILDAKEDRINDIFLDLMMIYGHRTMLPEIMEVFGKAATRKFLDLFAGEEFKVPSREDIDAAARNAHIYGALLTKQDTLESLAAYYDLRIDRIREIYYLTETILVRNGCVKVSKTDTGVGDEQRREPD